MKDKSSIRSLLNKEGYRYTPAREAMLKTLNGLTEPISAEDLYLRIKRTLPSINLSTVYRSLDLFTSSGILNKIIFNDGKARYELNSSDHKHHLVCLNCKKTIPIDNCPIHLFEQRLEEETSFSITGHNLEITGYCSKCKNYKPQE